MYEGAKKAKGGGRKHFRGFTAVDTIRTRRLMIGRVMQLLLICVVTGGGVVVIVDVSQDFTCES